MTQVTDHPAEKRVLLIYTGGTIGMVKNEDGVLAPIPNMLLQKVQDLKQLHDPTYDLSHYSEPALVLPNREGDFRVIYRILEMQPLLDSSNISVQHWLLIARTIKQNYEFYDGFVVLHGTDTLAYTASALSFLLENLGKTVIVTGSQVPIFENRNDGLNNLMSSLIIAANHDIPEVTVFFGYRLLRGNRTVKVCSVNCEGAFDSPNCDPLAVFDSRVQINSHLILHSGSAKGFNVRDKLNPNVALLRIFPTMTEAMIKGFLEPPVEGLVLQTFGAGNFPDKETRIISLFSQASKRGVIIVNCTQCFRGGVQPIYATSQALHEAGVIAGYDMTAEAALTKLSYVLAMDTWTVDEKRKIMEENIRGELTSSSTDVNFNAVGK